MSDTDTRAKVACDVCGQTDDHPMIHVMGPWNKDGNTVLMAPSFHFDCLPAEYENLLGDAPEHAVTVAAIAEARGGVHGDKLRAFIEKQPSDNELEES